MKWLLLTLLLLPLQDKSVPIRGQVIGTSPSAAAGALSAPTNLRVVP